MVGPGYGARASQAAAQDLVCTQASADRQVLCRRARYEALQLVTKRGEKLAAMYIPCPKKVSQQAVCLQTYGLMHSPCCSGSMLLTALLLTNRSQPSCAQASLTLLFSHGNAVDIGQLAEFFRCFLTLGSAQASSSCLACDNVVLIPPLPSSTALEFFSSAAARSSVEVMLHCRELAVELELNVLGYDYR